MFTFTILPSAFPKQPAIYFAIDGQDIVQYIGRSINPPQGWENHHKYKELKQLGKIRIAYLFMDDSTLLPDIEKALIQVELIPLQNEIKNSENRIEQGLAKLETLLKSKMINSN